MSNYVLKIKLLSDTTFGRGDGVAGLVDQEVEHDFYGFPYLRGRTLKGLLSEECDNLVVLLPNPDRQHWINIRKALFGEPGSTNGTMGQMHIGDACLPEDLRTAVAQQQREEQFPSREDVLASLTNIRRQTAIDPEDGAPVDRSLRSARVVIRELCFSSLLLFDSELSENSEEFQDMLALLEVGTLALRRIGSGRNRGRGHVQSSLYVLNRNNNTKHIDITRKHIDRFGRSR
jgi:CRISPR/Cas system CSM-associated protein Csm3 (group 7 of RAMP superfamily)